MMSSRLACEPGSPVRRAGGKASEARERKIRLSGRASGLDVGLTIGLTGNAQGEQIEEKRLRRQTQHLRGKGARGTGRKRRHPGLDAELQRETQVHIL